MMFQITDKEVQVRLALDNPWWESSRISTPVSDWSHRAYFDAFRHLLSPESPNRAVVLMGPRRVGKTVMLLQTVQQLIDDGVEARRILYVSVDNPLYTGPGAGPAASPLHGVTRPRERQRALRDVR